MSDFDLAWEFTAKEEGVKKDAQGNILSTGLNTVAGDPGGTTNFGFAQKYNPDIDVTQLTWDTAKKRAFTNYWLPTGCTNLDWPCNLIAFDTAFNQSQPEAQALIAGQTASKPYDEMLWNRLKQYGAKHPANLNFTRWWLIRVIHLRDYILATPHA